MDKEVAAGAAPPDAAQLSAAVRARRMMEAVDSGTLKMIANAAKTESYSGTTFTSPGFSPRIG